MWLYVKPEGGGLWKGDSEAVNRAGGRESEAAGQSGLGLACNPKIAFGARVRHCKFLNSRTGKRVVKILF